MKDTVPTRLVESAKRVRLANIKIKRVHPSASPVQQASSQTQKGPLFHRFVVTVNLGRLRQQEDKQDVGYVILVNIQQ